MKTSSAREPSTERGKQSQMASTSRWKCIVPLGMPVVPDVKPIRQMSSRAVSAAANCAGCAAISASSDALSALAPPKYTVRARASRGSATASSSARSDCAHSTASTRALPAMAPSSRARSSGMVGTAMHPALITASTQAAKSGVLAPRSSTRLPVTSPIGPCSTWAMRSTWARNWS
ncbi:hypothetical protein DUPY_32370 [Duganella phyllosphaerae]|uniref:Uncharacterized protein n=1 Tax=Duganella phyllosphaerae TaxID=762836 RepID=A0A1E7WI98_9BURK|nr:hypothetical protein DUPY_32370 [Duganella phyllosphaerae]